MNAKSLFCNSIFAVLSTLALPTAVFAANTLVVNKTLDSLDGSCDMADCSLREAMAAAEFGDTIEFSALFSSPQRIILNGTNLTFSNNITLKGPGRDLLTISGNQQSRVFLIPTAFSVTISDLSLRNGFSTASGGAIAAAGYLDLRNVTIAQNRAGQYGSGILAQGGFNINNVIFSENQSQRGGGIYVDDFAGGFIRDSTISDNTVTDHGGGIYVDGGSITLIGCTVGNNIASVFGGGIYNNVGTLKVYESAILANRANGTSITASGIDNYRGNLEIRSSTFSGNNIASNSFTAGALWTSGPTIISSSTFSENSVMAGASSASAIYHSSNTLIIRNSIIAGNSHIGGAKDINSAEPASITSQGFNLIGDPGNVGFNGNFDQVGSTTLPLSPMLLPLANNGGPTMTHAPQLNSPVIDRGFSFALTFDQRGSHRPEDDLSIANAGDSADIGAYEVFQDIVFKNSFEGRSE